MRRSEIEQLLPDVMRRAVLPESPPAALLSIMESLHAQPESTLRRLDHYFNPHLTPDRFVPYLSCWVDLESLLTRSRDEETGEIVASFPAGTGRLRELIAAAASLYRRRGTTEGLRTFLETATGSKGFRIEERVDSESAGTPVAFHIRVVCPQSAEKYHGLIEKIIRLEKPAYVTHEVGFE